jgi:hypothetical protein
VLYAPAPPPKQAPVTSLPATTVPQAPAVTTTNPTVTATPDRDLTDGETIDVNVTGFGIGGKVFLSECGSRSDVTSTGCGKQLPEQEFLVTGNNRAGGGPFVVHDHAAIKGYDTTELKTCVAQCVLVATLGSAPGRPYAITTLHFRTTSTTQPSSARANTAPCAAKQLTALAPQWLSPLQQQTDDLLQFTNTGNTCELSGYPTLVATAPGQPDLQAKPGIPVFPPWNGNATVLPHGSTARLPVAAVHSCTDASTASYTTLSVAMPGGGSVKVTLPTRNASPNPDQNGHNLTLQISSSCPPYVGYFSH